MMNVKQIRENMTEAALSVESVMRGHPRITLQELSTAAALACQRWSLLSSRCFV